MKQLSQESKKSEEQDVPSLPKDKVAAQKEESKQAKSAFDTFMDVSSIFANPLFGASDLPSPTEVRASPNTRQDEDYDAEESKQTIKVEPVRSTLNARAEPQARINRQPYMGEFMSSPN